MTGPARRASARGTADQRQHLAPCGSGARDARRRQRRPQASPPGTSRCSPATNAASFASGTGAAHRHHRRRLDHRDRAWFVGRPRLRYADRGVQHDVVCVPDGDALHVVQDGTVATLREVSPWPSTDTAVDPRLARAPVAGTWLPSASRRRCGRGRQPLVCVEAMKMKCGWWHGAVVVCAPST